METTAREFITINADINAHIEKVWSLWTEPMHIIHWNNASDDWCTSYAENNLLPGGNFLTRMEAKDGSFGFDFTGTYTRVVRNKIIWYTMPDTREVEISFDEDGSSTRATVTFAAENENPLELQRSGWQAILNNFKKYVEEYGKIEIMQFNIEINAAPETVFKTMLGEHTYSAWTTVFNPTSVFKGSWDKGSKILFLGTDNDGKTGGMVSRIRENIPGRFLSIEHNGIVKDGKEITSGPEVESWAGSLENYTFTATNGKTLLSVDIDSNQEFKSYFSETWPAALKKLKSLCEGTR